MVAGKCILDGRMGRLGGERSTWLLLWPLQGRVKPWLGPSACYLSRLSIGHGTPFPQSTARQLLALRAVCPSGFGSTRTSYLFPGLPCKSQTGWQEGLLPSWVRTSRKRLKYIHCKLRAELLGPSPHVDQCPTSACKPGGLNNKTSEKPQEKQLLVSL